MFRKCCSRRKLTEDAIHHDGIRTTKFTCSRTVAGTAATVRGFPEEGFEAEPDARQAVIRATGPERGNACAAGCRQIHGGRRDGLPELRRVARASRGAETVRWDDGRAPGTSCGGKQCEPGADARLHCLCAAQRNMR